MCPNFSCLLEQQDTEVFISGLIRKLLEANRRAQSSRAYKCYLIYRQLFCNDELTSANNTHIHLVLLAVYRFRVEGVIPLGELARYHSGKRTPLGRSCGRRQTGPK
jgi:hypothetical protein